MFVQDVALALELAVFVVLVVVRVCSGALPICLMSYRASCERLNICRASGYYYFY